MDSITNSRITDNMYVNTSANNPFNPSTISSFPHFSSNKSSDLNNRSMPYGIQNSNTAYNSSYHRPLTLNITNSSEQSHPHHSSYYTHTHTRIYI